MDEELRVIQKLVEALGVNLRVAEMKYPTVVNALGILKAYGDVRVVQDRQKVQQTAVVNNEYNKTVAQK